AGLHPGEEGGAHRAVHRTAASRGWIGKSAREETMSTLTVDQILSRYDEKAPLSDAYTIPAPWYVDARVAELERQAVFSKTWQVIGRADQVAQPGQFVTSTVAGEPLVAVRGNDGVLRAFYNVCRHHAAAVVTEPCGKASILHCPYHGWNYGLD